MSRSLPVRRVRAASIWFRWRAPQLGRHLREICFFSGFLEADFTVDEEAPFEIGPSMRVRFVLPYRASGLVG